MPGQGEVVMPSRTDVMKLTIQAMENIDSVIEDLNQSIENGVVILASFGAISLILILLVALLFNGFIRPILVLKQVCLICKAVTKIIEYTDYNEYYNLHFYIVGPCLLTIHQLLSCVFFHHIYKGVCEMIVQKNTIFSALKKSFIAILVTAIATGIDRAICFELFTGNSSFGFHWKYIVPIEMGLRLTVTILMFIHGIKILISLNSNRNFKENQERSHRSRQRNLLAISISGMMVFQLMKLALHVLEVLFIFANYKKLLYCTIENAASFGKQMECFLDFGDRKRKHESFAFIVICYHLEDISILALIFYWKIKNKISVPEQADQSVQLTTA